MIKRGLALSLTLGLGSVAQGGAVLELDALPSANAGNPAGTYDPNEPVTVDFYLTQTAGGQDHLVRLLKLHFAETSPELALGAFVWSFGTRGHYKDEDRAGGPPGVAIAYVGEGECSLNLDPCNLAEGCPDFNGNPQVCTPTGALLGPRPPSMLTMPADGTRVKVATLSLTMPAAEGTYTLDAMNAPQADPDLRAALSFGYGCTGAACNNTHPDSNFPITFWRANTADFTGGSVDLTVGAGGGCTVNFVRSTPADEQSWWRSAKNIARFEFDGDIVMPNSGDVQIRKLLPAGAFDVDESASFTFSIENDGSGNPRILKMVEIGTALVHRTWYGVDNISWAGVCPFDVEFLLQIGDCDTNKFVTPADLSCINTAAAIPGIKPDDARCDIDGNRFCTPADLSVSNAHPSGFVLKPSGH